jgi:hypothetical protein
MPHRRTNLLLCHRDARIYIAGQGPALIGAVNCRILLLAMAAVMT